MTSNLAPPVAYGVYACLVCLPPTLGEGRRERALAIRSRGAKALTLNCRGTEHKARWYVFFSSLLPFIQREHAGDLPITVDAAASLAKILSGGRGDHWMMTRERDLVPDVTS